MYDHDGRPKSVDQVSRCINEEHQLLSYIMHDLVIYGTRSHLLRKTYQILFFADINQHTFINSYIDNIEPTEACLI